MEFPTRLEFGLRHGVQLPAGFNAGQEVSFILDRVTLAYSQVKSFNDLPTPFACVATELNTGKEHVFHDGSLSLALRATMSLPGIFTPVRSGNNIYADGGLLNNLPVDVAKDMGAQLTIAVYLQADSFNGQQPLNYIFGSGAVPKRNDRLQRAQEHANGGCSGHGSAEEIRCSRL